MKVGDRVRYRGLDGVIEAIALTADKYQYRLGGFVELPKVVVFAHPALTPGWGFPGTYEEWMELEREVVGQLEQDPEWMELEREVE